MSALAQPVRSTYRQIRFQQHHFCLFYALLNQVLMAGLIHLLKPLPDLRIYVFCRSRAK
ncbi:hypothetical protein [Egbenema bharatensis]|uniref:hypothetical protein n=1 Tax=Egbenema bharatensis TaxID=3463334 RepID=UPI003A8C4DBA